jgi:hypothetical protein
MARTPGPGVWQHFEVRFGDARIALRYIFGCIIAVGIISVLSVVTLRKDLAGVAGTDSGSLVIAGRSLVAIHKWTFLLGPAFCAGFGNGLLLGYLMYTSGLVPRRMALLGLIGGPLAFATAIAVLFGAYDQTSAINSLFTVPETLWEASLTLWLNSPRQDAQASGSGR